MHQGTIREVNSPNRSMVEAVLPQSAFPLLITEPEVSKWKGYSLNRQNVYCIFLKDTFELLGFNEFATPMVHTYRLSRNYQTVTDYEAPILLHAMELDYYLDRFLNGDYLFAEMLVTEPNYQEPEFTKLLNLIRKLTPKPSLVETLIGEQHIADITQFHALLSGYGVLTSKEDFIEYRSKTTRRGTRAQLAKSIMEIKQMEDYQLLKKQGWENLHKATQKKLSSMVRALRLSLI